MSARMPAAADMILAACSAEGLVPRRLAVIIT